MEIETKPLHYGHSNGHTDITYSSDGTKLISGGGDGDVRIWKGFDDDDPFQTCAGELILCTKQKGDHLILATDNSKVELLQFPSGEKDGIIARFTSQVNHIAINKAHDWIAIASDDMTIQIVELDTRAVKTISPLTGVVLSVAIDSTAKYIAASCGDGNLKIIDVDHDKIVKELNVVPKINSFENAVVLTRCDFDVDNLYLAYPNDQKITFLNTTDWLEAFTLTNERAADPFSIVQFSPSGNYVAASTVTGDIIVWNILSQSTVGYLKHSKSLRITAICWNPLDNDELAFTDCDGYIGLAVDTCNSSNRNSLNQDQNEIVEKEALEHLADGENGDAALDIDAAFRKEFGGDDEPNENEISLEQLKRDVLGEQNAHDNASRSSSPCSRPRTPEIPLQAAFMPSSTPEHLDPRYMCWNDVGIVRCYGSSLREDEEGSRSIEVEFHDSSLHNSLMLPNYNSYTMGSISSAALAVANSSSINVVPLGSSSKEWSLDVPEDAEIIAVAASHNLICFGTNRNLIHVCSIFGIQRAVFSCPGPIVCMSAFYHYLMVAYHAGSCRKNDQCIDIMLVKLEGTTIETKSIKSALGPEATLRWMGFTDVGTPAMTDSNGMLYVYPLKSEIWLPFCNTADEYALSNVFFVTAVYESLATLRGIKCRGSCYPTIMPTPTLSELQLAPPFLNMDTEKHQLEADIYTWSALQVENTSKRFKEASLKVFAMSVKNKFDQRAVELMEMLQNQTILSLAIKYVNKLEKKRLAEKLTELSSKLITEETDPIEITTPTVTMPRKLKLKSTGKSITKSKPPAPSVSNAPDQSEDASQDLFGSITPLGNISTQDLAILNDEPKNPFLKSLKKKTDSYNPLSLTDKHAGVNIEKENKVDSLNEKRKLSEISPVDSGKEKQRKLDKFLYSKNA